MKRIKEFLYHKRLEKGTVIDQVGSVLVVAFIFALILAYSAYGKIVQQRLLINNVAKEYLYVMEENGYMSDEDFESFVNDMAYIGVTVNATDVSNMGANGYLTDDIQVTYGDKVTLAFTAEFENPFFSLFTKEGGSMFRIMGFDEKISYDVVRSSTAKW